LTSEWLTIRYRGYYDIPRMIVVKKDRSLFLLDCPFDDSIDEYPSVFTIYRLPPDLESQLDNMSWERLGSLGERLGQIPVELVEFDTTRRNAINASIFDQFE
jgi:hypothetical protein